MLKQFLYFWIYFTILSQKKKGDSMKKEFAQTRRIVKNILTDYPQTRNSDNALYIKVVAALNPQANDRPFANVLSSLEELGLPCFETVRRTRQKLQAEFPELQACDEVQDFRTEREEQFRKEFG